jgi:hypothetical protein
MPDDDRKPTFEQIKDAMMPPGTDKDALWAALKGAHRTGGHVPGQPAPDISFQLGDPPGTTGRGGAGGNGGWTPFPPATGPGGGTGISPPPDPFTKGSEAAAGLAEMFEDLLASGIPLASVERILGAMLATYGAMTKDEP